jgi:hypothetical protein
MDIDDYRLPSGVITRPKRVKRPPRHGGGQWFIKGPIPLDWLAMAAKLPGKTLATGLALWFESGRTKDRSIRVTSSLLKLFAVGRHAGRRALRRLADAGLVSLKGKLGHCPVAFIQDTENRSTESPEST